VTAARKKTKTRDRGTTERGGVDAVLAAAISAFAERGYHGTSVRDLAERQGLSVAALYYHFPSKLDLLMAIMTRAMDDIISDTEQARDEAEDDPVAKLTAIVRAHVLFHTRRQAESFVGNSELRSLDGEYLRTILDRRDHEERIFQEVIAEGVQAGVFDIEEPRESSRAILAMCIHIHTWYHADGSLSAEEVADRYVALALKQVGAPRPADTALSATVAAEGLARGA
jgi:AcrR family transcriptional regulator